MQEHGEGDDGVVMERKRLVQQAQEEEEEEEEDLIDLTVAAAAPMHRSNATTTTTITTTPAPPAMAFEQVQDNEDDEEGEEIGHRPMRRLRRRKEETFPSSPSLHPPPPTIISLLDDDDDDDNEDEGEGQKIGAVASPGSPIDLTSPLGSSSSYDDTVTTCPPPALLSSPLPPLPRRRGNGGGSSSQSGHSMASTVSFVAEGEGEEKEGEGMGLLSYLPDGEERGDESDLSISFSSSLSDSEEEEEEEEEEGAMLGTIASAPPAPSVQGEGPPPLTSATASLQEEEEEQQQEEAEEEEDGLDALKATELRAHLRAMGIPSSSRTKEGLLTALRASLRSQRLGLAAFPTMSTERFSDRRGKVNKEDLPKGVNGRALCRLCQTECPKKANTFCSKACVHEHRLRTQSSYVRKCLLVRDRGVCAMCTLDAHKLYSTVRQVCQQAGLLVRGRMAKDGGREALEQMQAAVDAVVGGTVLEGKVKVRGLNNNGNGEGKGGSGKRQRPRRPFNSGLFWHGDHIVPVVEGGGLQGLENFRTLCVACHQTVTGELRERRAAERRRTGAAAMGEGKEDVQVMEEEGEDEDEEEDEDDV